MQVHGDEENNAANEAATPTLWASQDEPVDDGVKVGFPIPQSIMSCAHCGGQLFVLDDVVRSTTCTICRCRWETRQVLVDTGPGCHMPVEDDDEVDANTSSREEEIIKRIMGGHI